MAIKHKIKFKNDDRARGTSPAELRSSGPKQRPERVATMPGVEGESVRRDVSLDDMERREYLKFLRRFFKGDNTGSNE
jgi:hypothetical protein